MNNQVNEKEIKELNDKFVAFLHTQEITQENIQTLILEIIKNNLKVTRKEIANKLSSTPDTIKYQLDKMKKAGVIKHAGSTKAGYWEIIE